MWGLLAVAVLVLVLASLVGWHAIAVGVVVLLLLGVLSS